MDTLMDQASPEAIAKAAVDGGCKSVAFTYNDPVIFAEYAMDTADACRARGVKTVAVTAGYMHAQARREFYAKMDAANVDLKAFTDEFYVKLCGAHLQSVLDTLVYLKRETNVWFEITTLLIPGKNDSAEEITAMCAWIMRSSGPMCRCISRRSIPTTRWTTWRPRRPQRCTVRARSHCRPDCTTSTPATSTIPKAARLSARRAARR